MKKLAIITLALAMAVGVTTTPAYATSTAAPKAASGSALTTQVHPQALVLPAGRAKAPKTKITTSPKSVKVTEGSRASFSVKASGKNLRYKWQMQTAGRGSWKTISSSSSATISRTSTKQNNSKIKVVVSGSGGSATSKHATLTVSRKAPRTVITADPKSVKTTEGSKASFSVKASGSNLRYKWQMQTAGRGSWKTISTGSSATISRVSAGQNNSKVKVVVSGSGGSDTSNTATMSVARKAPRTQITSHPASATVTQGSTHAFNAKATGSNLYYEWQIRYPHGNTWYYFARGKNASSGKLTNISTSENGSQIRVLVTGSNGYVYSRPATLKVKPALTPKYSKLSATRVDYSKPVTVTVYGKDMQDVNKVTYAGSSTTDLSFRKTSNSVVVTLPKEPAPRRSSLTVRSNAGGFVVYVQRSRKLSDADRREFLADYERGRRSIGLPSGRPGSAMIKSVSVIKDPNAWYEEAWDSKMILDAGFRYKRYETEVARDQRALDKVNRKISEISRKKPNKGQQSQLSSLKRQKSDLEQQIRNGKSQMNTQLSIMRSYGASV